MVSGRCTWCLGDPLYEMYHDNEWGVPVHDDRVLFEHLVLDGAQAGLSWITILRKREAYRAAFDNFDIATVADYEDEKIAELLRNPGIIRNRQKIRSAINNARATLVAQKEFGSLDALLWQVVNHRPIINAWTGNKDIPTESDESRAMSAILKRRGFTFVGPTICYAFMQAVGIVNDHIVSCFRYKECSH